MANYKRLYAQYLDRIGIAYTEVNETVVKVVYGGDNLKTIPIFVLFDFDSDGDPLVTLRCCEIANFKDEKLGYMTCAKVNARRYRWVEFYIDDNSDIIAKTKFYVDEETCGSVVTSMVQRMVNIIDECYPTFAKALWS